NERRARSKATAEAASGRFEGEYGIVPLGVDTHMFAPAPKDTLLVVELEPSGRFTTRALLRLLPELPQWEALLLHTKPLGFRPAIPRSVRRRVHVRATRGTQQRVDALGPAAIFVAARRGPGRAPDTA